MSVNDANPSPDDKQRSRTAEMLAQEERLLAARRNDPASPYFAGGVRPYDGRRRFVLGSMAALGGAAALGSEHAAAASLGSVARDAPPESTHMPRRTPARRRATRWTTKATARAPSSRTKCERGSRPARSSLPGP